MQVPTIVLAVAMEIYLALLVATALLIFYARKQKKLIRRQQEKLRELIEAIKISNSSTESVLKSYHQLINEELELTQDRFALVAPRRDISEAQPNDLPAHQRIVALRYAFLRAEQLSTTQVAGSEGYWKILQQTLEPLLQPDVNTAVDLSEAPLESSINDDLEMYKKRVDNLEKFKQLFFELEKRWNDTQANAQNYYNELYAMADSVDEPEKYATLLGKYSNNFNDMTHYMHSTSAAITGRPIESKTINIIRQDPRAAEEIMKLRNVAADQYRVISNLQRKLEGAVTTEEKDLVIKELEQQLQRQVRFVQESDTCVQLLEEELTKANEKIAEHEGILEHEHQLEEENQRIKETLQNFTHESKELLGSLESLERENDKLKSDLETTGMEQGENPANLQQIQSEFNELRKQYTELEEKYLELKFK